MKQFLLILMLAYSFVCCNPAPESNEDIATQVESRSKEVHVYSARTFEVDQKLYDLFEKETGIKVVLTQKKGDLLLNQLIEEGEDSPADLLICFDAGQMQAAIKYNLLDSFKKEALDEKVPLLYRHPQRFWYGIGRRSMLIAYHKGLVTDTSNLSNYLDLAKPVWDVGVNVSSSANISNRSLVAAMISNIGAEKTLNWVQGISKNLAIKPTGGDYECLVALARGTGKVALVNSNAAGQFFKKEPQLSHSIGLLFPNQATTGCHSNLSAGGLYRHAKNRINAAKLLVFLASETAQKILTEENFEYPVNPAVNPSELLQSWGDFYTDPLDVNFLESNHVQAKDILGQATRW